jgi:hypothetical protein
MLFKVFAFLAGIYSAQSYSAGYMSCSNSVSHGTMSTNGPFAISIADPSGKALTAYSAGQSYTFQLHSTGTATFRGYILAGFASSGTPNYGSTPRVGTISPVSSGMIAQTSCSGGVTQSDGSVDKISVGGTWSAPSKPGTGTVQLFAIVITTKNGNNYRISSPLMLESTSSTGGVNSTSTSSPTPSSTPSTTSSPTSSTTSTSSTTPSPTSAPSRTSTKTPSSTMILPGASQSPTSSITPSSSITTSSSSSSSSSGTPSSSLSDTSSGTPSGTPSSSLSDTSSDTPSDTSSCSTTASASYSTTLSPSPSSVYSSSIVKSQTHNALGNINNAPQSITAWAITSYVLISVFVSLGVGIGMFLVHKQAIKKLASKKVPRKVIRNPVHLHSYSGVDFNNVVPTGASQDFLARQQHQKTSFAPVGSWAERPNAPVIFKDAF